MSIFTKNNTSQKVLNGKTFEISKFKSYCVWNILFFSVSYERGRFSSFSFFLIDHHQWIPMCRSTFKNCSWQDFFSKVFLTACPTSVHIVLNHLHIFVRIAVSFVICFVWPQQKNPLQFVSWNLLMNTLFQQQSRLPPSSICQLLKMCSLTDQRINLTSY